MSAFLVEAKNINSLAWFLYANENANRELAPWADAREVRELCGNNQYWPLMLAEKMRALNVESLVRRYGPAEREDAENIYAVTKDDAPHDLTPVEFLKSLHCWHYQCAEGDVPDEPLYQAIERILKSGDAIKAPLEKKTVKMPATAPKSVETAPADKITRARGKRARRSSPGPAKDTQGPRPCQYRREHCQP